MVRVVDEEEQLTQGAILRNPRTRYKRSKNVPAVTTIALICAHICARLLQPLAQSLIGSPGTLETFRPRFYFRDQCYAGRATKFAPVKGLRFSELILGILLFEFRFTVFFPMGCGVDS